MLRIGDYMNKKGFTLIEVIAAIALLALLALLVTPNLINVRKDMLQRTYESRVSLIKNAALDYANDHLELVPVSVSSQYNGGTTCDNNCLKKDGACVTIGTLISDGYLAGSDNKKTEMRNPVTNENMNSKRVCVRYTDNNVLTRKLISYIVTG